MAAEPPIGQRFSQVYLERGKPARDSLRLRTRLAQRCYELTFAVRDELAPIMIRELGCEVPGHNPYYRPWEVFQSGELRDVLDSVTLVHQFLLGRGSRSGADNWRAFVARAMAEENVGYRVDEQCGVHYDVDEEFERSRAAAVAALQHPDLRAVLAAYEDAHRHMDSQPQDTKAAVRSMFEAVETAARLICPEVKNLNRWLAENTLRERCLAVLPTEATEQKVWGAVFDGLADWVDGLHNYRHGQGVTEPIAPSEVLAVEALSSGATYLRVLGDCYVHSKGAQA